MTRPFSLILTATDIETIIEALNASQEHSLADRVGRQLERERAARAGQEEAAAELAKLRESRAANAVLTKRQAECLAAVRAGRGPSDKPYYWVDENGVRQWRWTWSRSMGGAVWRMVEALIEEGLLTERRKLTEGGLARLVAWEAKHGKIGDGE